jgi:CBS domain-containing protein
MTAGKFCSRDVVFADRSTPLVEAAKLMREHHVGSLVVVEEGAKGRVPVGILTDRDIVVAVVAPEVDPRGVTVGEVMQSELVTVREEDSLSDVLRVMRRAGVRRAPVLTLSGTLAGIIASDDLLGIVARQLDDLVRAIGSERAHETRARK